MELMECAVSKTPESARAQMQQGLDQTKQAWEAIPADQKEVACGQTLEAAKASYAAMGCTVD